LLPEEIAPRKSFHSAETPSVALENIQKIMLKGKNLDKNEKNVGKRNLLSQLLGGYTRD
jgi:hypothetical protein